MQGIARLFEAKARSSAKAIAVLISALDELERVAVEISPQARRLANAYWPGPLTLILRRHPALPASLSPLPTIGVRVPDHPVALALLRATGPMAVTSANLSGQADAITAAEVAAQLGGRVDLILDGGVAQGGTPSTVVDCTADALRVVREGPVSLENINAVVERQD